MKIRTGFVSNSSSSSFICSICGETESGYDASPEDLGMKRCENGHEWHDDCNLNFDLPEDDSVNEDGEVLEKYCPMCTFVNVDGEEAIRYLLKKNNLTQELLVAEIKAQFTNYTEFCNYLKGK